MLLGDAAEPGSGGVGDIGGARGRAAAQHPGELRRLLARRPPQRLGALPLGPAALAPRLLIAAQRELIPAAAAAGAPLPARLPPAPGSSRLSAAGRIPGTGRGAAGGGAGGRPGRGRLRPPPESAAGAGARGGTGRRGRSAGAGGAQNGSARAPSLPREQGPPSRCLHGVATVRENSLNLGSRKRLGREGRFYFACRSGGRIFLRKWVRGCEKHISLFHSL